MKKVKVLACVLTAAMAAGVFAGCSKTTTITTAKFQSACEKLKLEEFDIEDSASPDYDDLEDGIYVVADEDYIEDNPAEIESFLGDLGLGDVIDADDVTSLAFAAKCSGAEDLAELDDFEDGGRCGIDFLTRYDFRLCKIESLEVIVADVFAAFVCRFVFDFFGEPLDVL